MSAFCKVTTCRAAGKTAANAAYILRERACDRWETSNFPDHAHLLVDAHPNIAPSRLVNTLKTISSREIRREFPAEVRRHYRQPVLWHRAYCILSAGGAPLEVLKRYIENQGSG